MKITDWIGPETWDAPAGEKNPNAGPHWGFFAAKMGCGGDLLARLLDLHPQITAGRTHCLPTNLLWLLNSRRLMADTYRVRQFASYGLTPAVAAAMLEAWKDAAVPTPYFVDTAAIYADHAQTVRAIFPKATFGRINRLPFPRLAEAYRMEPRAHIGETWEETYGKLYHYAVTYHALGDTEHQADFNVGISYDLLLGSKAGFRAELEAAFATLGVAAAEYPWAEALQTVRFGIPEPPLPPDLLRFQRQLEREDPELYGALLESSVLPAAVYSRVKPPTE